MPFGVRAQDKRRALALLSATSAPASLRDALDGFGAVGAVGSAHGKLAQLESLAAAVVRAGPNVIVAHGTPAVAAAAKATQRIPVVMAPSWERLGAANVTGLLVNGAPVAARIVELTRELNSNARRIAVLANADDSSSRAFVAAMNQAAARIRVPVGVSRVRTAEDYEAAFAQWDRLRLQVLIVHPTADLTRAAELALRYRLPAIALSAGFVEAGGLMSYSENARALGRGAARYVEHLLNGAKAAGLPVEHLDAFDLTLSLKTARAMEIEFPDGVLARADAILQ